ncbi:MAG: pseudaminic acid cytidylyltransferase [Phycisphaerales bacterium]|nr:pseudaminic acid cytidylyltransferase [Phycisphaerales bacterium]
MANPIAVIPARGGSKRIEGKNIKPFHGRPMIEWPIATALASSLFEHVVVTTDDEAIAQVARDAGAATPFLRDPSLADDHTGTTEVIADAVARLSLADDTPVCCIYATAAFVTAPHLRAGLAAVTDGARWSFSVGSHRAPIDRAYVMRDGRLQARSPEHMEMRSQDLEPTFFDAGQFYWATAATWRDPNARVWDEAVGVEIEAERCIDIDSPEDWRFAHRMFALLEQCHDGDV